MKWPDFIIAGCMKCGTTALRRNLKEHPKFQVYNETNFWLKNRREEDLQTYKMLFSEDKIVGEKCAVYYENKNTMERIFTHIPECKLILCIRNPVDRLHSEFNMKKRQGFKVGRFSSDKMWGPTFSHLLKKGLYFSKFEPIFSMFPKRNIHIVVQEWMATDTVNEINKVFDFLGAERIEREVKEVPGDWKDKHKVHVDGFYENWKRTDYEPMDKETRGHLVNYYTRSNQRLWELLRFEVKGWKK